MPYAPKWATLTEGEEVVWNGGPSAAQLVGSLFWALALVVVGLLVASLGPAQLSGPALALYDELERALTAAGFVIATVGLLVALVAYLRYESVEYLVTTEELYVKRGFVSRSVRNLRLDRVQDTGFTQSGIQRLLGYGNVHVSTAGGSGVELVFENVPDPAAVNGIVAEQLDAIHAPHAESEPDPESDAAERSDRRREDRSREDRTREDRRRDDGRRRDTAERESRGKGGWKPRDASERRDRSGRNDRT